MFYHSAYYCNFLVQDHLTVCFGQMMKLAEERITYEMGSSWSDILQTTLCYVEHSGSSFDSSFVGRRAGWGYDYYIVHGTLLCMADFKSVPLISKSTYLEVWQRVVVSFGIFWS